MIDPLSPITKPVLFILQIAIEGPSRLTAVLEQHNIPWRLCRAYEGEPVPQNPIDFSAIIPLGGPMNVYEEDRYPFLAEEDRLLKNAVEREIPILGICLGCQLLAKACGAEVMKNPQPEIGWLNVSLTDAGLRDPLFHGLEATLPVFQWHGDTVALPDGAEWLAYSVVCRHQAFRIGRSAYGLQFHVEVTPADVSSWTDAYLGDLRRHDTDGNLERHLRNDGPQYDPTLAETTHLLFGNFLSQLSP